MRRAAVVLLILICSWMLFSNPIPPMLLYISELYFDNDGKWYIELMFIGENSLIAGIDTLVVDNGEVKEGIAFYESGIIKCSGDSVWPGVSLYVLTSDSLGGKVDIRSDSGYVVVSAYSQTEKVAHDWLAIGKHALAVIGAPPEGGSVCRYRVEIGTEMDYFCYDKTPTIGVLNDTLGVFATMKGFIYDKSGDVVSSGEFSLDLPVYFDHDGSYVTRIFARKVTFSHLDSCGHAISIEPVSLDVYPDSTVSCDLHLEVDYPSHAVDVRVPEDFGVKVACYPNPFNSNINFYIDRSQSLENKAGKLLIYNCLGQVVKSIDITGRKHIMWSGRDESGKVVNTGVYYYVVSYEGNGYQKGSIIFLK